MMRAFSIAILLTFGGFVLGRSVSGMARLPSLADGTPRPEMKFSCAGGPVGWLTARIEPLLDEQNGFEARAFYLRIVTSDPDAKVRYAIERVSDRGEPLVTPYVSDIAHLADPGELGARIPLTEISDGFYLLRATVVGVTASGEGSDTAEVYIRAINGAHAPMTSAEWLQETSAGLAIN